jgi:hypothetical protein
MSKYFLNTTDTRGSVITVCKICGVVVFPGNISIDGNSVSARLIHLASHAVTELERQEDEETQQE